MSEKPSEMEGGKIDLGSSPSPGQDNVGQVEQSSSVEEGPEAKGSLSPAESGVSTMQESAVQQGEENPVGENERGVASNERGTESDEKVLDEDNDVVDDQEEMYEEVDNDESDPMEESGVSQQTKDGKSPNKIQDLVNKAIESKLTGFQEQMEKMMAVLQTVSHGQAQEEGEGSEADIFEIVEEERDEEEQEVDHVDEEEMRMAFSRQKEDRAVDDDSKPTETPGESDVVDKKQSKDEESAINEEKRALNEEMRAKREKMLGKVCALLEIEPSVESHEKAPLDSKGNEIKHMVLPADSVIKEAWSKSWSPASNQINSNLLKKYRWPQEDMEKYGRSMKVEAEAERLVRLVTGKKKGRALPEDVLKVYSTTKTADSFVRFQQKIISYASYYLAALGRSVKGEKEVKSEDVEEILSNLQQCLVDLCEVSVQTNTLLIRNQRRIYLNSMKVGHHEVQNALLNLPFTSKSLFGDSLSEVLGKYGLDTPKKNVDQNGGGSRRADGRQGGNVGGGSGGGSRNAGGSGGGGGGGVRRRGGQSGGSARKGGEVRAFGGNRSAGRVGGPPGRMGTSPRRMGASPGGGTNRGIGMLSGRRDERDRLRGVSGGGGTGRRNQGQDNRQQGRGGKKRPSVGGRNNSSKRRKGSDSKPMGTSWQPSGSFGGGYMPLSRDFYSMGPGGMEPPSKMEYSRLLEEKARIAASKEQSGPFGSSFDAGPRSSMYPPSSFGGGYYRLGDSSSYSSFMNFSDSDGPLRPKGPSGGLGPSKPFSSYSSYANDDDFNQY